MPSQPKQMEECPPGGALIRVDGPRIARGHSLEFMKPSNLLVPALACVGGTVRAEWRAGRSRQAGATGVCCCLLCACRCWCVAAAECCCRVSLVCVCGVARCGRPRPPRCWWPRRAQSWPRRARSSSPSPGPPSWAGRRRSPGERRGSVRRTPSTRAGCARRRRPRCRRRQPWRRKGASMRSEGRRCFGGEGLEPVGGVLPRRSVVD